MPCPLPERQRPGLLRGIRGVLQLGLHVRAWAAGGVEELAAQPSNLWFPRWCAADAQCSIGRRQAGDCVPGDGARLEEDAEVHSVFAWRRRFVSMLVADDVPDAVDTVLPTTVEHVDEPGQRLGGAPGRPALTAGHRRDVGSQPWLVALVERERGGEEVDEAAAVGMVAGVGERDCAIEGARGIVVPEQPPRVGQADREDELRIVPVPQEVGRTVLGAQAGQACLELLTGRLQPSIPEGGDGEDPGALDPEDVVALPVRACP